MTVVDISIERLGVVMTSNGDATEVEGVLNPGSARGPDGELYLFPRVVARGNESRVARARVLHDDDGVPVGVERLGIVLAPDEPWERNHRTGGVEDPRITRVDALDAWVMTYAAYGPLRSRVALAISDDLVAWRRLGPVSFAYDAALGTDLNLYTNKDALLFPEPVPGPDGQACFALLHRPTWQLDLLHPDAGTPVPRGVADPRPGIWVSFVPADRAVHDPAELTRWSGHRFVAGPEQDWEHLEVGGGTPPIRTDAGWLTVYHGVAGDLVPGVDHQPHVRYSAGVMVHDPDDVTRIVARTPTPVLEPEAPEERVGIVPNVVFPTAIDVRDDHSADVYYGMADDQIGAARLRW